MSGDEGESPIDLKDLIKNIIDETYGPEIDGLKAQIRALHLEIQKLKKADDPIASVMKGERGGKDSDEDPITAVMKAERRKKK